MSSGAEAPTLPLVSIIVPAKNQERTIEECLRSLNELDYPKDKVEVVLVDGHSTDRTVEIARRYGARVIYDDGKGRCRAHGLNAVIAHVEGEYLAFTDADCTLEPAWLKKALPYFRLPGVGGVGGHTFTPASASPFAQVVTFLFYLNNPGLPADPRPVSHIAGANSVFLAKAIRPLFPLPEVSAGEDAVLSLKLRDAGWKLVFAPDVVVWHTMHYSGPKALFRQMRLYGQGGAQLLRMDPRLVRSTSKWAQALVPILAGPVLVVLLLVNKTVFIGASALGLVLILTLSALFLSKTNCTRGAILLPVVGVTMALGHSIGFLKEFVKPGTP